MLFRSEIKDLLTEGHTKLLKGFKSKQGKSFDAVVAFDGEYNTTGREFDSRHSDHKSNDFTLEIVGFFCL